MRDNQYDCSFFVCTKVDQFKRIYTLLKLYIFA